MRELNIFDLEVVFGGGSSGSQAMAAGAGMAAADGKISHGEAVAYPLGAIAASQPKMQTTFRAGAVGMVTEFVKMGIDYAVSQPPYNGVMKYEIEHGFDSHSNKDGTNY